MSDSTIYTDTTTLINGIASDHININDRALHYGDGLFETILYSDDKLYYWQKHYQRLYTSAKRLDISCPSENLLLTDIAKLLESNNSKTGVIKILLSRGSGDRGYQYSHDITTKRLLMLSSFDSSRSSLLTGKLNEGELFLCNNRVSSNTTLAGIKHLNRLENVLARNEWREQKSQAPGKPRYADGVMLDDDQRVIECTSSNIFAIRDNQLYTPDLSRSGVEGVMRDITLSTCVEIGIDTTIAELRLDQLQKMDELFITNSLIGLKSINRFLDTYFANTTTTSILKAVHASANKNAHII